MINSGRYIVYWAIKALFLVIPFIPLYISASLFFPYITGKAFVFRAIIELSFFAWVWLAIFYKEYRPKFSAVTIAISVWLLVVSAATIFGVNPTRSFWSNFERMEGLITYLHLAAYFVVIGSVFKKKDWMLMLNLFVITGLFQNAYVLLQKLGFLASPQGGFRTDGTIGNPTYLAAYLIFIFGIAVILWFHSNKKSVASYFYAGSALWTLASIYFTASRGPVLGLLMGLLLSAVAYLLLKKADNAQSIYIKKAVLAGLAFLIVVPAGLWSLRDTEFVKNSSGLARLTSLSFTEQTITSRFSIWKMSFEGVKEKPLLGWGPENYTVVFSKYFRPELWQQEPWFDRSHNIIFDWLINAGVLGLLSYLSIFGAAGYMIWKNFRKNYTSLEENIFIAAILFAYFFQNLFVFDNIATYIGFFTLLGYIHSVFVSGSEAGQSMPTHGPASAEPRLWRGVAGRQAPKSRNEKFFPADDEAVVIVAVVGAVSAFAATFYFLTFQPLLANLNLLDALRFKNADPVKAFSNYQQALTLGFLGKQEIREQLYRFSMDVGAAGNLPADFKDTVLRTALLENQKGVLENPLDPRPYLLLGGLYSRIGMSDEALKILNQALQLSPNKQQIYFEIADPYFQKGDYANAVAVLEKGFQLDKTFTVARSNLTAAYILNGQQDKADQLLREEYGTVDVADKILTHVYSRVKNYPRLIGVWQAFVKADPSNIEYRKNLVGSYLLQGDRARAIAVLQQAINDFPKFQQEGAGLIDEIRAGK